mgnify:CR=1 FL=1
MSFARGTVIFTSGEREKTVTFEESFTNTPVVKLTPNSNINVYLSDVQNSYFTIQKNDNSELTVNYVAIESEL